MDEQATNLADGPVPESAPKRNPGWFQPGASDRRINREGRPRGSNAGSQTSLAADRAPYTDRLMALVVPERDLAVRLSRQKGPWVENLPEDFTVVASRVDAARGVVVFVIRSREFPRIAQGTVLPQFRPSFNGLRWRWSQ
jgi:hypothetical protein